MYSKPIIELASKLRKKQINFTSHSLVGQTPSHISNVVNILKYSTRKEGILMGVICPCGVVVNAFSENNNVKFVGKEEL